MLIIPLALAIGGFWLRQIQRTTEQRRTTDNQRETALQSYIDKISDLLLKEYLGEIKINGVLKPEHDKVRNIARVRTITILFQLDARRIGYVFAFLREAGLMSNKPNSSIVSLSAANLIGVNLSGANLSKADLSGAILFRANLHDAILFRANLRGANLREAHDLTQQQIDQVFSCEGALLPEGLTCHYNQ